MDQETRPGSEPGFGGDSGSAGRSPIVGPGTGVDSATPGQARGSRKPLPRSWLAALVGVVSLAVGLSAGVLGARGSFAPDAALSLVLGVAAFVVSRVVERTYDVMFAPRSSRIYGEELREAIGGLLDSSLRTAEWRHALAHMLERVPRDFVETVELGSELGYVIEREYLLRAEELGLIKPICWRERRGVDAPRVTVDCHGVPSGEVSDVGSPPASGASTHVAGRRPRAGGDVLTFRRAGDGDDPADRASIPRRSGRTKNTFELRGGKLRSVGSTAEVAADPNLVGPISEFVAEPGPIGRSPTVGHVSEPPPTGRSSTASSTTTLPSARTRVS